MRRFRTLRTPKKAHPLVKRLFTEMNYQRIGILDLADRSGVNRHTLKDWSCKTVPTVSNLEACLNVLGLELVVAKRKDDE